MKFHISALQKKFLDFAGKEPHFFKNFYFSGGTCLAIYYLQHRFSEDLDFFSLKEFSPSDIFTLLKKGKKILSYQSVDYQQSFNRNIFHLLYPQNNSVKVEFTYYPFMPIEKPKLQGNIKIDSLKDIAVNKIFTILQEPRGRDFYDFYEICRKTGWKLQDLIKLARIKFDYQIDYLQLGTNLLKVSVLLDDPIIKSGRYQREKIEDFFQKEARKLKDKIIK